MSPPDDDLVMISALQHWLFCKRQCALIHVESAWEENSLTASGRILHEHVDERGHATRRDLRQATALRLVSRSLGIMGMADMVEFHRVDAETDATGTRVATRLDGASGFWRPFPVEYKRGKPKSHRTYEAQLCAQAICLEEMLAVSIPAGALFYGEMRRRSDVVFDSSLRNLVREAATGVRELFASGEAPPPSFGKWCASCSLVDLCMPKVHKHSARAWLAKEMEKMSAS